MDVKAKVNEEATAEKLVMKDYNIGQQNLREDGEQGPQEEDHDRDHEEQHQGVHGIPCQTQ